MSNVRLIARTVPVDEMDFNTAEELIVYCARVSNPSNQDNHKTGPRLLKYCLDHKHVSIFEHAHLTMEVTTCRAISTQAIRHQSFNFQEFSQRYAKVPGFQVYEARRQDPKNRQNSVDDMSEEDKLWFKVAQQNIQQKAIELYQESLDRGIAKECARFILPNSATTKFYMTGNVRSWIFYLMTRCGNGTQLEHIEIAEKAKEIFCKEFPVVAEALEWI